MGAVVVLKYNLSVPQWHFIVDFSMGEMGIVNDQFRIFPIIHLFLPIIRLALISLCYRKFDSFFFSLYVKEIIHDIISLFMYIFYDKKQRIAKNEEVSRDTLIMRCTVLRLGQCLLTNTCTYGDNYRTPYTFIRGVHLA